MLKEFKEFAVKGNVIDMAVGIIIGAAFTSVVQSLVKDVMMPALSPVTGSVDFSNAYLIIREGSPPPPYETLQIAQEAGATVIRYGSFLNAVISFLLVSFAVFLLVRYINKLKRPTETPEPVTPSVKKCSFCFSDIAVEATRCPYCTSELSPQQ